MNTVADPDGCTRTMADSQKAAWRPTPCGPTAREGASPQTSTQVEKPTPRWMPFSRSSACSRRNASRSKFSSSRSSEPW